MHFYTQTRLHTNIFTQKYFYTQTLLHTNIFTQKHSYTQTRLHTKTFTHRSFYTHIAAVTQKHLLHRDPSALKPLYTETL